MDFLQVKSEHSFKKLSLELFNFHYNKNDNYREFCDKTVSYTHLTLPTKCSV